MDGKAGERTKQSKQSETTEANKKSVIPCNLKQLACARGQAERVVLYREGLTVSPTHRPLPKSTMPPSPSPAEHPPHPTTAPAPTLHKTHRVP